MKLVELRLNGFQSFGPNPTTVSLEAMTFLLGPNGAGKTAVLQALARMFALDPAQRKIRTSDFHVPNGEDPDNPPLVRSLWIEAKFQFPELAQEGNNAPDLATIPGNFAHMQLETEEGSAQVRIRLTAIMDDEGEIEETLNYVISIDANGEPTETTKVQKHERNSIQVHYLPAKRNPADHISYATHALLGRLLRAADWQAERVRVGELTEEISGELADNGAVAGISDHLKAHWGSLHRGNFYAEPSISFARNELDALLRHLTVGFTPGHAEGLVDFSRLSDGQQSLLYLTLVVAVQEIGRKVLAGDLDDEFDVDKLRPATFTLIAMEEPENSLSPHYLGRVLKMLKEYSDSDDTQALLATHAPALLKRVEPETIRYLRLRSDRTTTVTSIVMPVEDDEAYKFVREGVQAYPELYFSRLVILGEGDSEEIVVPRLLSARGILADDASVSIVPLGGRHVNHFWRLLHGLEIPYVTLLDLDLARHGGGWGRIRYALNQLMKFPPQGWDVAQATISSLPKWDGSPAILDAGGVGPSWIEYLERQKVFFSSLLDLDFMMLQSYPEAYDVEAFELDVPDEETISAVLGKSHGDVAQYTTDDQSYFYVYHDRFKLASKPAMHLSALAKLSDQEILDEMPEVLERLFECVEALLEEIPE